MHRLLPILCLLACNAGKTPTPDTDTDTDTVAESALTGEYSLIISVAPVGNLPIPAVLDIDARIENGQEILTTVKFRADDPGGIGPSDVLGTVEEVLVDSDGGFDIDLGLYTLPADYAPLGAEVQIDMHLVGSFDDEGGLCGDAPGEIVTFELSMGDSTFGGVRSDSGLTPPPACDVVLEELPRIAAADCPTLSIGDNTGFPSANTERSFIIVAPDDYDPANEYPLVFMFHGFGGTASEYLSPLMASTAKDAGVIMVVPQGGDLGGIEGFDGFSPTITNADLALFDDMLTCVTDQFSIDADRIHATGMSNGGLFTGYLSATRSSVLASVAPLSGGIRIATESDFGMPALITWGGPTDFAYEQDFDLLADEMIGIFQDAGSFVVTCEHTAGHEYEGSWWAWVFEFLLDHPATLTEEPYASGLPKSFPSWCAIPE
jgi:predicted esterase